MINRFLHVRRAYFKSSVVALLSIFCICFYLLLLGEFVAVEVWLFVMAVFLSVFLASKLVKSTLLHMVIGIAVITQVISVPIFIVNSDYYTFTGWTAVKDFSFTVFEFVHIYSLVAFFMIVVVCCVAFLMKLFKLPQLPPSQSVIGLVGVQERKCSTHYYLFLLIAVVVLVTPLNLWMFSNGISMTGIEPPLLPYRLSGVLHYLTSFIVPIVLALLYAKTTRAWVPALILMMYALLLGATHISKGALLLVILPILYFSILDSKYTLLSIVALVALVALQIVVLLRNVVYISQGGKIGADTASGFIGVLNKLFTIGLEDFTLSNVIIMMGGIFDRIESAQNLVLASKFNVDAMGGFGAALLGFNYDALNAFDTDSFLTELIGITLPDGFMISGGNLLAKSLLLTHSQPLYISVFAFNVAVFIFLGEWVARSISIRYSSLAYYYIVGGLYILFFYTNSGSTVFLGLLILLVSIVMIPRVSRKSGKHR